MGAIWAAPKEGKMPAILIIIFIVIVAIGRLAKYHNEQLEKEIGPVEFHPLAKLKEAREQRLKKKNELHIYIHDVKEDEEK
jgi:uncharacterized membrane protein